MKKKAKIAKPLKGKELKDERDERLHEEIVQSPDSKPRERFGGEVRDGDDQEDKPKRRRYRDVRDKEYEKRHGIERVLGGLQGTGGVDGFEGHHARGFKKVDGKHVAGGVLVSRSGYVRNLPDDVDHELWGQRSEELAEIAKRELRGRNATVFEGLVLNPLQGAPRRTVADLAHQFGVPEARIHRIQSENKIRMIAALAASGGEDAFARRIRAIRDHQMNPEASARLDRENREMMERAYAQMRNDALLLRWILNRSAGVEGLMDDARRHGRKGKTGWDSWAERDPHYELPGHKPRLPYVCSTAILKGYLDRLPGLLQQSNDPAMGDPRAPFVISQALRGTLPLCRVSCECGGGGPHQLWEWPNWWWPK